MNDKNNIWKFLQRELNNSEEQSFQNWINSSDQNQLKFEQVKEIWDESPGSKDIIIEDAEFAWQQFDSNYLSQSKTKHRFIRFAGIAASLLLVASAIVWYYINQPNPLYQELYTQNKSIELILPDSSIINLEENSYLRYFTRLEDNMSNRTIYLKGKGSCSIVPDSTRPFIVEIEKTGIKVLGTSFIVDQKDSSNISVQNIEGLIKFYELLNESNAVTIKPGEKFTYNGSVFNDLTPREEESFIAPEVEHTLEYIFNQLFIKYDGRFNTGPYGDFDLKKKIRIDLDQNLDHIIKQLDNQTEMNYRKTCPNCYEIRSLRIND